MINIGLWTVTGALLVPVGVVCAEIAASFLPRWRVSLDASGPRPRLAVLIPAHDEAAVIGRTLENAKRQLAPGDRLLVVADNCSDETAAIARAAGADVVERTDDQLRGKGYALDFGVRELSSDPPEIVVLLDADVTLRLGAIDALARQAEHTRSPAQGLYLLREAPAADGRDLVSHLAFVVRNLVRPLGLARLGGPCPLFGAGMAFPWDIIRDAPLATGNIVEDMALGLDLAAAGRAPLLCPDASIDGTLPKSPDAASSQRRRWEHGHLRTIITHVPRTFLMGLIKFRPRAMMLALDLLVPPLSFHVMLVVLASIVFAIIGALRHISLAPAATLACSAVALVFFLLLAWARFSPTGLAIKPLLSVPGYVLKKLPMYFAFFGRGEKQWKRTDRDVPPVPPQSNH